MASNPPPPDEAGKKAPTPSGPRFPRWFWLFALIAAVLFNLFFYNTPRNQQQPRASIPYSEFVAEVRAGNVSQVELRGDQGHSQVTSRRR